MHQIKTSLLIAATASVLSGTASAEPYYLYSYYGGQPWGASDNETAMNSVFGVGNWVGGYYETVNAADLFTAENSFIFMEGSDENANELELFLTTNLSLITSWVNAGGRLLLNAAPNEGDGMDFGFGVTLHYRDDGNNAFAVDPLHPIFSGISTAYAGSAFSHASVSGAGLSSILNNENGDSVLAEMHIGSGLALFGGMTIPLYQSPYADAQNLRANIISYAANIPLDVPAGTVPEPGSMALLGLGMLGLAAIRRRKPSLASEG